MAAPNKYDEFIKTLIDLKVGVGVVEEHMTNTDCSIKEIKELLKDHLSTCYEQVRACEKRFIPIENFQANVQGTVIKLAIPIIILLVGQFVNGIFRWF